MTTTGTLIPQLFIRKGRALQQILPDQCSPLMEVFRAGRGSREMGRNGQIDLYDINGKQIGWISFNGRAWLGDSSKTDRADRIEIPQTGIKTAAQRELEGWK